MASYIAGILVAAAVVVGLYFAVENRMGIESRLPATQDKLDGVEPEKLREIAMSNDKNRVEAILQLGERPGDLEQTVPILTKYLMSRHDMSKIAAESSMRRLGVATLPHIRSLVDSGQPGDIQLACSAMRAVGDGCEEFVPALKELMFSDEIALRKCGVFALQGMGKAASMEAMDGLIDCLKFKEDFNVQCMTCRVLEKLGIDALEAEDALLWLLENGNVSARSRAAICLGAIGPTASDVDIAKVLGEKLKTAQLAVEIQRLIVALAYLGPEASGSLELIKSIAKQHQDASVQASGALAIWKIGGEQSDALEVFREQIKDSEGSVDAIALVGSMGKSGLPLLDDITQLFESHHPAVRETAVITVGNFGPGAIGAKPLLEKMLEDPDPLVRNAAENAIKDVTRVEEAVESGKKE